MKERGRHLPHLEHGHSFGQDRKLPGEGRTIAVIALTAAMMVVEVGTGMLFGSMALLADGLHMASHAAALSISAFAYVYARRHAHDARFSFGTGKVNALGGFTGAVLLAVFALMMAWESAARILDPVDIAFNQAIFVAVLGLLVNGASVFILGVGHHHPHEHEAGHGGKHAHGHGGDGRHDHNLRAAYLHVFADALTSLLAIFALLAAKYFGLIWMDPLMGIVGAVLVSRWSFGLLRATSGVLLDREGPEHIRADIEQCIEAEPQVRICDLHLWSIGPDIYSAIVSVVAEEAKPPSYYKELLLESPALVHVTVEVHESGTTRAEDGRMQLSAASGCDCLEKSG